MKESKNQRLAEYAKFIMAELMGTVKTSEDLFAVLRCFNSICKKDSMYVIPAAITVHDSADKMVSFYGKMRITSGNARYFIEQLTEVTGTETFMLSELSPIINANLAFPKAITKENLSQIEQMVAQTKAPLTLRGLKCLLDGAMGTLPLETLILGKDGKKELERAISDGINSNETIKKVDFSRQICENIDKLMTSTEAAFYLIKDCANVFNIDPEKYFCMDALERYAKLERMGVPLVGYLDSTKKGFCKFIAAEVI